MQPDRMLDSVILWVDDSAESRTARDLLSQTGIEFEERTVNSAPTDDLLDPPTLQTYNYRHSGLNIIQNMANDRYPGIKRYLELDREYYMSVVEMEDKTGISIRQWPYWSVRYRQNNS